MEVAPGGMSAFAVPTAVHSFTDVQFALCNLNLTLPPTMFPFFDDLVKVSECQWAGRR